jgi:hypothetical protein
MCKFITIIIGRTRVYNGYTDMEMKEEGERKKEIKMRRKEKKK